MTYPKRMIEVDLPTKRISPLAAGEVDPARAHLDAALLVGAAAAQAGMGSRNSG